MLKFKKLIFSIIGILVATSLLLSTFNFAFAAENASINYDIVNTAEWSKMSRVDRVKACQLSDEQMKELSTAELIQAVFDYPFFIDMLAFNTNREGFLHVLDESVALKELLKREDKTEELIGEYKAIDISKACSTADINDDFSDLWKLEILIAQPEILNDMDEEQFIEVFEIAEEKYREKSFYSEYEGLGETFYKSLNENGGISTYATNSYVYTPKGNKVSVSVWQSSDGDFSSTYKKQLADETAVAYPNVTKLRDATIKYNCHSYAWYSKSASNTIWMPYPGAFITDGSYPELTKMTTVVGNKIVYYESVTGSYVKPTHTGVIYSYTDYPRSRRTFVLESKWGSLGLYRHSSIDCPYAYPVNSGSPCDIKYFT